MKVTAPNTEYTGTGPGGVEFRDGVAELDLDKPEHRAALSYFRDKGYGVADEEPVQPEQPVPPDSREVGGQKQIGTELRDAAVNPKPSDFLAPVNAGQADPHGPLVVAPGVHALPPGPIVPGDVHVDDPRVQEANETAVAEAVLVEGRDVGEVTQAAAEHNGATAAEPKRPAVNAPKDEWLTFAQHVDRTAGVPEDHTDPADLTKAELIDRYGKD